MTQYLLSEDAALDLDGIWDHIAEDSIDAADSWIGQLFDAFDAIGNAPGIGHKRDDLTAYPVLFWPLGAYLIIYRATSRPVAVHLVEPRWKRTIGTDVGSFHNCNQILIRGRFPGQRLIVLRKFGARRLDYSEKSEPNTPGRCTPEVTCWTPQVTFSIELRSAGLNTSD